MTAEKFSIDFDDKNALAMLLTCAFDLLAQTEAQHRSILAAQARLQGYVAKWESEPPTSSGRKEGLHVIARVVSEVLTAIRTQRIVAVDMQQTVSSLRKGKK